MPVDQDKEQTGLDTVQTGLDTVQTDLDTEQTDQGRGRVGLDKEPTGW